MGARIRFRCGAVILAAVLVLALGVAPALAAGNGTIQGTMTRGNGGAMNGGSVYIYKVNSIGNLQYIGWAQPNASGFWSYSTAPDNYKLLFSPINTFYAGNGWWRSNGLVPAPQMAEVITVVSGGTATCDATIPVAFTIEGTVTAHASGNVLEDYPMTMWVLNEPTGEWLLPFGFGTQPDGSLAPGTFQQAVLPGFKYRVQFSYDYSPFKVQYWPGASTLVASSVITGTAGQTVSGIDAVMRVNVTSDTVSGADRVGTGVEVSKRLYVPGSHPKSVIVTTGYKWADALSGAALAGAADGPILLTARAPASMPTTLDAEVVRLKNLGATEAYVLGSESVVGSAVFDRLEQLFGTGNVHRLWGADRYATSAMVATTTVAELGAAAWDGTMMIATGRKYADALSASPVSAAKRWPIVLAETDGKGSLTPRMRALVKDYCKQVIILGGTGVVSSKVESELAGILGGAAKVDRWWGADRFATAADIGDHAVATAGSQWQGLAFANSAKYADSLCGGPLLAAGNSLLMPTPNSTALPTALESKLTALASAANHEKSLVGRVMFLGGTPVLSDGTRAALVDALE